LVYPAPMANRGAISALHQDFVSAGYTTDNVAQLLGPTAIAALDRQQPIPARRSLMTPLSEGNRLAGLISCFMLGDPISPDLARAIFATLTLYGAKKLNLITTNDDGDIVDKVDMSANATDDHSDMWVVANQTDLRLGPRLPAKHILGIGKASMTLAEITPRASVVNALDIGTGCGIQALHLL